MKYLGSFNLASVTVDHTDIYLIEPGDVIVEGYRGRVKRNHVIAERMIVYVDRVRIKGNKLYTTMIRDSVIVADDFTKEYWRYYCWEASDEFSGQVLRTIASVFKAQQKNLVTVNVGGGIPPLHKINEIAVPCFTMSGSTYVIMDQDEFMKLARRIIKDAGLSKEAPYILGLH